MSLQRPVVFDYDCPSRFLRDMLAWHRAHTLEFSVRKLAKSGCSPTLVSQLAKGTRKLTRDRVPDIVDLLRLNRREAEFLDRWVADYRRGQVGPTEPVRLVPLSPGMRKPKNGILTDWLNAYVKDASRLKDFQPDPRVVHRLLGGIASPKRIEKSLNFLLREGFLRRTLDGKLIEDEALTTTTDGIPNLRLRAFHKAALDIAKRGIDLFPVGERRASTLVLALNDKSFQELRTIMTEFYERLLEFAEAHNHDNDRLYQVVLNLSPVGGSYEQNAQKN